ncbi:MAG: 50S ribosomal protein L9 [Proteobacteria bacterium]|nr:50S ribosomal protein L9 [Pseudomonadota bacterium]MBU1688067.1 50S ribosomal protein L9 [Pseudomonadota bacterium]
MELILKETIDTLGEIGDVVNVKPGYGRNFLVPHGKAVMATKSNLTMLEKEKAAIDARKAASRAEAESIAKKLSGITIMIEQRAGTEDKLFGSVTAADITEKLAALGVTIDRKKIQLDEPIKTLGEHMVTIKIGYQVSAVIKVQVAPLSEETEA